MEQTTVIIRTKNKLELKNFYNFTLCECGDVYNHQLVGMRFSKNVLDLLGEDKANFLRKNIVDIFSSFDKNNDSLDFIYLDFYYKNNLDMLNFINEICFEYNNKYNTTIYAVGFTEDLSNDIFCRNYSAEDTRACELLGDYTFYADFVGSVISCDNFKEVDKYIIGFKKYKISELLDVLNRIFNIKIEEDCDDLTLLNNIKRTLMDKFNIHIVFCTDKDLSIDKFLILDEYVSLVLKFRTKSKEFDIDYIKDFIEEASSTSLYKYQLYEFQDCCITGCITGDDTVSMAVKCKYRAYKNFIEWLDDKLQRYKTKRISTIILKV